jgi:SmpA/OmlA family protein
VRLELHPEARGEFRSAALWYEERRPGLGDAGGRPADPQGDHSTVPVRDRVRKARAAPARPGGRPRQAQATLLAHAHEPLKVIMATENTLPVPVVNAPLLLSAFGYRTATGTTTLRGRSLLPLVLTASIAVSACVGTGRDLGTQVTRDHVRAVRLGMTRAEVEQLLGQPFDEKQEEPGHIVLTYSRRPVASRFYPMLWVHLRNGKVGEVYAKRYGLWVIDDDIGIYGLSDGTKFERSEFSELFPA